jgi:hypothetical protein
VDGRVRLLVFCLDGADLTHLADARRAVDLPHLSAALAVARPLPSTPVPQTPVAWTALLCGAPPDRTGVWGWYRHAGSGFVRLGEGDLPPAGLDWRPLRVMLAGLPFLPAGLSSLDGAGPVVLAGLRGPTKRSGGSRPHIEPGADFDDVVAAWQRHHAVWAASVWAASVQSAVPGTLDVAFVHCDSVDWFSHRFGPGTERGRFGWRLADALLGDVLDRLAPEHLVVVSDHGSAPVRAFVRVHEALFRAGLAGRRPGDGATLDDLVREPVFCGSDYGALWVRDAALTDRARAVLHDLGATAVDAIDAPGAPHLVPTWPDGWLALMPPHLDPADAADLTVTEGPEFARLRGFNWAGDHARAGLIGSPDPAIATALDGLAIHELRSALVRLAEA